MGRQLSPHGARRLRRVVLAAVVVLGVVALSGCSAQTRHEWSNLAMPDPAAEQSHQIFLLWRYAWVAALATGVLVWGLIFYACVKYRRRSDDEVPVQTRYNLPLEIFYTIAPIVMVVVFFVHTVRVGNEVRDDSLKVDHTVYVVGQQWSWTFNYVGDGPNGKNLYTVGAAGQPPTLVLPVDQTVEFKLHSPDVIHSFGIPAFLETMDVFPGKPADDNHFSITPTVIGDYRGKCRELCGTYHSRMLFNVKVVSEQDYQDYLKTLVQAGQVSDKPLLGGSESMTESGETNPAGPETGGTS